MVNNQSYILCDVVPWEFKERRRWRERERQKNPVGLDLQNNRYSLLEFISRKKKPNIWQIERDGISAIKFETELLHFLSDVFVAVAVFVA